MGKKTISLICVLVMLFAATPAFANDGQAVEEERIVMEEVEAGITPDSPLYFLDLLMEKIQYALTLSPNAKIELKASIINERLAEAEVLIRDGNVVYIESVLAEMQEDLQVLDYEVEIKISEIEEGSEVESEPGIDSETLAELEEVTELMALANEAKAAILEKISGLQQQLDELLVLSDADPQAIEKIQNAIAFQNEVITNLETVTTEQVNRLTEVLQDENTENDDEHIERIQSQFSDKIERSLEKSERAMERLERALERIREKEARQNEDDEEVNDDEDAEIEDEEKEGEDEEEGPPAWADEEARTRYEWSQSGQEGPPPWSEGRGEQDEEENTENHEVEEDEVEEEIEVEDQENN